MIPQRTLIGIIALLLLGSAGVGFFAFPEEDMILAACVRIGLVMAAIWLALPEAHRIPWWTLGVVAIFLGVFMMLPAPVRWGSILSAPVLALLFWPQIREIYLAYQAGRKQGSK